jgi:glycine hydroxymethyltransferase
MHIIAAKALLSSRRLAEFKQYQQSILDNAQALASGLLKRGIKLVSGGTDNHLMLLTSEAQV